MKLDINDLILEPVMSEKSTLLAGQGQYVFRVHQAANKTLVKQALETQFGVKVKACRVLNMKGKKRKTRKNQATYTPGWKKAMVTLSEGSFDFFETLQ